MSAKSSDVTNDKFDAMLRRSLAKVWTREDAPSCPDPEMLAAYCDGALPDCESSRIDAHRFECLRCDSTIAAISSLNVSAAGIRQRASLRWILPPVIAVAGVIATTFVFHIASRENPPPLSTLSQASVVADTHQRWASMADANPTSYPPALATFAADAASSSGYQDAPHVQLNRAASPYAPGYVQQEGITM